MTAPGGSSSSELSRTAWVSRVLGAAFTGAAVATQVGFQECISRECYSSFNFSQRAQKQGGVPLSSRLKAGFYVCVYDQGSATVGGSSYLVYTILQIIKITQRTPVHSRQLVSIIEQARPVRHVAYKIEYEPLYRSNSQLPYSVDNILLRAFP